jgi:hypothetical protein
MVEGFWIAQYAGINGNDSGVLVLLNGKVFGGDSGFTYLGVYHENGKEVTANVEVANFNPNVPNVLNIPGDFTLNLKLSLQNANEMIGVGTTPLSSNYSLKIKLTRRANL